MIRNLLFLANLLAGLNIYSQITLDEPGMLRLVNEARKAGGTCGDVPLPPVPALVWDDNLEQAARVHANDMMRRNFFSHTGSDNSSVAQRVERQKFNWRAVGENLALGYENTNEAVQGWLNSPGHCKNILNPHFTRMGAAISRDGKYWVQVFAAMETD